MNKIAFVIAMVIAGSAFAKDTPVPVPPKRPICATNNKDKFCKQTTQTPTVVSDPITVPVQTFNTDKNIYGATVDNGKVVIHNVVPVPLDKPWYKFW